MDIAISIDTIFKIYFYCIIIDFISAIVNAFKDGKLKSRTCAYGMYRSFGECIVLIMFILTSKLVPDINSICSTFLIGFIFKELLSIMENLKKLGVCIPSSISNALEAGANKVDKLN
ncbi:MAG: phage holin family protein [Peptostreptococcaceae bacterium]